MLSNPTFPTNSIYPLDLQCIQQLLLSPRKLRGVSCLVARIIRVLPLLHCRRGMIEPRQVADHSFVVSVVAPGDFHGCNLSQTDFEMSTEGIFMKRLGTCLHVALQNQVVFLWLWQSTQGHFRTLFKKDLVVISTPSILTPKLQLIWTSLGVSWQRRKKKSYHGLNNLRQSRHYRPLHLIPSSLWSSFTGSPCSPPITGLHSCCFLHLKCCFCLSLPS